MKTSYRIESIDLVRGLAMVLMALDHVRDYFHADAFLYNPLDLTQSTPTLFMTRWITHFCAPVFVFLAGTSAYLIGQRKSKKELSGFLLKRGVWLIFLELTVVNFAWFFNFSFPLITLLVIWALGFGMIVLAVAIHLPYRLLLFIAVLIVAGHNLLDQFHPEGAALLPWTILHGFAMIPAGNHFSFLIGYAVIPWTGIMLLGYCFGKIYTINEPGVRSRYMLLLGSCLIVGFVILRLINVYGDPFPFVEQDTAVKTILSFINVFKYPPSLFYALVTLGPSIILLSQAEKFRGTIAKFLVTLGRVPLFYYLVHIYLIHLLALAAAVATGFSVSDMVFSTWVTDSVKLKGYGFSLWTVYAVWIGVVAVLYPLCRWFERYKSAHREQWWLGYL